MAQVTCPNCGRRRVVMDGKRKRCRKCGTPLTARLAHVPQRVADEPAAETTEQDETSAKTKDAKTEQTVPKAEDTGKTKDTKADKKASDTKNKS